MNEFLNEYLNERTRIDEQQRRSIDEDYHDVPVFDSFDDLTVEEMNAMLEDYRA